jgi:hypothetical protein
MQLGYDRLEVSSSVWVQAVTDAEITNGIIWGIVLSSLFAFVSLFVFTGALSLLPFVSVTLCPGPQSMS